ncbi:MAG: hypothetical protein RMJ54_16180 [Roseiflexaceae bacterium]|nr:hypothetical protein [Roseiflexaceae bacterium]
MNARIQMLKAEIAADLKAIAEIYSALAVYGDGLTDNERIIVVAYYLHNLYCAFEGIFQRVAEVFENHISDKGGWHAELLRRMTLDIEGVRPRLLSDQAYDSLDELRRFRHLFRSAYRMRLDAERLALVYRKAQALEHVYRADIERFLAFLDTLAQVEGE